MAWVLHTLLFIVGLACFIMVVVKMFQRGQTGLGIASIILAPCAGLGVLLAFIMGWVKATEWNIKNLMLAWTAVTLIDIVLSFAMPIELKLPWLQP